MKSIGEVCTRDVVTATRDTTVSAAALLMRKHHAGTLVVCDQLSSGSRFPAGIVTDRDIVVGVVAPGLRSDTITVADIMPSELFVAREKDSVEQSLELMRTKGVRRLPVVDDVGHLIGIVALDDLVTVLADELYDIVGVVVHGRSREAATRR